MPILFAALALVLGSLAEWLHWRRVRRIKALAFGPGGPRAWVAAVPFARPLALGAAVWGFATLYELPTRPVQQDLAPEGGYRHLLIALDVSPSMQIEDGGPTGKLPRKKRASDVILSVLERAALDQVRVSIVAFYTGAKPVVIDTFDAEVVRNALNDLPLSWAFDIGKTDLFAGVKESADLAKGWEPRSATLLIVTDGDSIPDTGTPQLPPAVAKVAVLGIGNPRVGTFIDGHQSRQDTATLRQLARRLGGDYFDTNTKHLSSAELGAISEALPLRDTADAGKRELAIALASAGSAILALLPLALVLAGSPWAKALSSRPKAAALPAAPTNP